MRKDVIPASRITDAIQIIRGQSVVLDSDPADLYGVATKALNQAVGRNRDRFPQYFMFQLTPDEARNWSQSVTSSRSDSIRQLMAPAKKPPREIGFHVRETPPRYGTRKRR